MPASPPAPSGRASSVRRVLLGILVANLAVVAAKLAIGVVSGSLAVLSSALDSGVDALNNVLALAVVAIAAKAPDEDHPYGHRKFETLGALAIVGFLAITCFELVRGGVSHLAAGAHAVRVTDAQVAILVATLAVNAAVAWYERRRGRALASEILTADAAHTRADVFITLSVVIGVLLARRGWTWLDPLLAIVVALVIVRISWGILSGAVPVLVDQQAVPAGAVARAAAEVPGVRRAYGIRSRGGAALRYAELTIAVDGAITVEAAHAIADEVERRLMHDVGLHEVTVHVEPC